jgi:hypothetical protein
MGFGKRFRHTLHSVTKHVTQSIIKPTTIVKSGVDLSKQVTKTLHPVTAAIGKVDAVAYGTIGGGIVGAAITKKSGNKKVFGGTGVDTIAPVAIQIEKPLAAVAGGLIAGGVGSSLASAGVNKIAPADDIGGGFSDGGQGFPPGSNEFADSGGDTTSAPSSGGGSAGLFIALGIIVIAVAMKG